MASNPDRDPVLTPANRIDISFVPRPIESVAAVSVSGDTVLLDGWVSATVLNSTGAMIWDAFDGLATLEQIITDLAEMTGVDQRMVASEVLALSQHLGALGLLQGVGPPDDLDIELSVEQPSGFDEIGAILPIFQAIDLNGAECDSTSLAGTETLLVNWNPSCDYCGSIAYVLAACEAPLLKAGIRLVLLASGTVQSNREMLEAARLKADVLLRASDELGPFAGIGTPTALHLDPALRLISLPAYGNVDVPALIARLAGVDQVQLDASAGADANDDVRYLLETGGLCAQGAGAAASTRWLGTRVYRLTDFHVGVRYDNDAARAVLDALFTDSTVSDRRAGHSYSVALPSLTRTPSGGPTNGLNLLLRGGDLLVRSRSVARVLRALLWQLQDRIVGFDPDSGRMRVRATAARIGSQMVLLQPALFVLEERLQPLLARRGVALADVPFPELDPRSLEVVIPDLAIPHDRTVIESHDTFVGTQTEPAPVLPGRYPLIGWGVMYPSDPPVTHFSPAEAAAATLSFVENTDDARVRLRELGTLFEQVDAFGLSYDSEADYVNALCEALGVD